MSSAEDMSTPVTRGELREELAAAIAPLATKAELAPLATKEELAAAIARLATKAELAAAIAPLATKAELAAAIAPLATKEELAAAIAPLATKAELEIWGGALSERMTQLERRVSERFTAFEQQLQIDLARHTG